MSYIQISNPANTFRLTSVDFETVIASVIVGPINCASTLKYAMFCKMASNEGIYRICLFVCLFVCLFDT